MNELINSLVDLDEPRVQSIETLESLTSLIRRASLALYSMESTQRKILQSAVKNEVNEQALRSLSIQMKSLLHCLETMNTQMTSMQSLQESYVPVLTSIIPILDALAPPVLPDPPFNLPEPEPDPEPDPEEEVL